MDTATGCHKQEVGEVGVVEVAHTRVDPRAMVVHLHNTSTQNNQEKLWHENYIFFQQISRANRIASNEMLYSAAPHLGLYCFPMSNTKEVNIIGVKYMGSLPTVLLHFVKFQSFERFFLCVNLAINISNVNPYNNTVGSLNGIYGIKSPFSGAYGISNGAYGNIDYLHRRLLSFQGSFTPK